jgi:hypothetical protein
MSSTESIIIETQYPYENLVNLTGFRICVYKRTCLTEHEQIMCPCFSIKPSDSYVAFCRPRTEQNGIIIDKPSEIHFPLFGVSYPTISGVPSPEAGKRFIVLQEVAERFPDRKDLLFPGTRAEDGIMDGSIRCVGFCFMK